MFITRQVIKNLILNQSIKIVDLLNKRGLISMADIENIIVDTVEIVRDYERKEREKRKCNIPEYMDIITDVYDKQGRRRYSLGAKDDYPIMYPDKNGFWTPIDG